MTEETIAALATQVAALRESLTLSEETFGDRIGKMEQTLEDALASAPKGPPAVAWAKLSADERQAVKGTLSEWISSFLRRWYPSYTQPVCECILNHPEGLVEISNLLMEFKRIYSPDRPVLALSWPTQSPCMNGFSPG